MAKKILVMNSLKLRVGDKFKIDRLNGPNKILTVESIDNKNIDTIVIDEYGYKIRGCLTVDMFKFGVSFGVINVL